MISNLPSFWYALTGIVHDPLVSMAAPSFVTPITSASWVRVTDSMLKELSFSSHGEAERFLLQRGFRQTVDVLVWDAVPPTFVETMMYKTIRIVEMRVYS